MSTRGDTGHPDRHDDSPGIQTSGPLTSATWGHARWVCELRGRGGRDGSRVWPDSTGSLSLQRIQVLLLLRVQPLRARLMGTLDVVPPLEDSTQPHGVRFITVNPTIRGAMTLL